MPQVLNMRDFPDGVPHGAIYCGRPMRRVRIGSASDKDAPKPAGLD
jgi:hypothetical protein